VQQDGVQHRAEHVVLALVECPVADPHRPGAGVAGQLVAGRLGEVPPPVDPVHDLQGPVVVGLEVGDELHELVGLPVEPEVVQRLQGEGGVPHPRVPVVPVPLAAGRFGQRRGQGGDLAPVGMYVRPLMASAERWICSRQRWSGRREPPSRARQ
jgi:hypothetical protein